MLIDNEKEGPYRIVPNLPECPWCGEDMPIENRDMMKQMVRYSCGGCNKETTYLDIPLEEAVEEGYKT